MREYLLREDPIDLYQAGEMYLHDEAYLFDEERFFMRAATVFAMRYAGADALPSDDEIQEVLRSSVEQLMEVDMILAKSDREVDYEDPRYWFLTETFYVKPGHGPLSSAAFNGLPRRTRRGALELLLVRSSLEECVEKGFGDDDEEVIEMGRTVLAALMSPKKILDPENYVEGRDD